MPTPRSDRYAHSLLAVCEQMHMSRTGAGDTLSEDDRFARLNWLQYRLMTWIDSPPSAFQYDEAVRVLVKTTLADEGVLI